MAQLFGFDEGKCLYRSVPKSQNNIASAAGQEENWENKCKNEQETSVKEYLCSVNNIFT